MIRILSVLLLLLTGCGGFHGDDLPRRPAQGDALACCDPDSDTLYYYLEFDT